MSASPYGYPTNEFHLAQSHRHPVGYMPHPLHMGHLPPHMHMLPAHPYPIDMYNTPAGHIMHGMPPPELVHPHAYSNQPHMHNLPSYPLPLAGGGLGLGVAVGEQHVPMRPDDPSSAPGLSTPPHSGRRSIFHSLRGNPSSSHTSSRSNENLPPIEHYLPLELVCDSEDETAPPSENDISFSGSPMIPFGDSRALWDSSSPSSSPVPSFRQELLSRTTSPRDQPRPPPPAASTLEHWSIDLSGLSAVSSAEGQFSPRSSSSASCSPPASPDSGSGASNAEPKRTSSHPLSPRLQAPTVPQLTISPPSIDPEPSPRRRTSNEKLTSPRRRSPRSPRFDAPEARFTSIEQCVGQITSLCKDQRGCRFLQKKLDEKDPNAPTLIFNEVFDKIVELMTDPFGNYLCQKLLEHCDETQCLAIIELVSKHIVQISKNLHGTRAIQKMIEFLSTEAQISLVVRALAPNVVTLIKDLNGNHVIQRCLHRLSPTENQFLFDAVAKSCVEVATHRHGCCVFQRCLDHASESQRFILIQQIARHGYVLVRDPYGNYVVQYVLDLQGFDDIKIMLTNAFKTHMIELSSQKFSSNVIEKCLSACPREVRLWMVEELMESVALTSLLRDPFGNYVIQTALTVSESDQHHRLVEAIRPHLPSLRNTSYGKRIQNKILRDGPSKP